MEKHHTLSPTKRETRQIKHHITCDTTNLTYMIQCKRCKKNNNNNIQVKLSVHLVNALKSIDRQQIIQCTQTPQQQSLPTLINLATRSQTWILFCWNYNPPSACHAVKQEKRTSQIEAKPCHQTVLTEGMNIELFLFFLYNHLPVYYSLLYTY